MLTPSDGEVARILEVSVAALCDPAQRSPITIVRDGHESPRPPFTSPGSTIWGATAMVLAEFLTVLGWNSVATVNAGRW